MPFRSRFFIPLDVIHLLNVVLLIVVILTLIILSIVHKLHDCEGFYSRCHQVNPENITIDPSVERALTKDVTALAHLLTHKLARLNEIKSFKYIDNFETTPGNNYRTNNYDDNNNPTDENKKFSLKLVASDDSSVRYWNYDWIGIDQYVILIYFLFVTILGFTSTLFRNRLALFISIILYLIQIIQLSLIEVSDDRDFPPSIFRDGKTVARYSLIYFDQSALSLILKSTLLILLLLEGIILLVSFVIIRYENLLNKFSTPG